MAEEEGGEMKPNNDDGIDHDAVESAVVPVPVPVADPTTAEEKEEEHAVDVDTPNVASDHRLKSTQKGYSEVEQIARRVEIRRANRIRATYHVRVRLLKACQSIAIRRGYEHSRISLVDLVEFRERIRHDVDSRKDTERIWLDMIQWLGFRDQSENLLDILNRAIQVVNSQDDDWFHYKDFVFYETQVESSLPWMRSELGVSTMIVFFFYFFTPIFFCSIVQDKGICVEVQGKPYAGWMSSLYFASTTLSTVGYGDLTVTKDDGQWRIFFGSAYMVVAAIVAITAFSAAADAAFATPLSEIESKAINFFMGKPSGEELLPRRVARLRIIKLAHIFSQFLFLNLVGIFVSRAFDNPASDDQGDEEEGNDDDTWTWMTSFYWSIQTTTTIGYGDLNQSFEMRWFQIFYLTLSTYFVGSCLGKLGRLRMEILEMRRQYAWDRRKVTRGLIQSMHVSSRQQGDDYVPPPQVDQFEFVLASLLMLGKISSDDLEPIMNKYRQLCDPGGGFIRINSDIRLGEKLVGVNRHNPRASDDDDHDDDGNETEQTRAASLKDHRTNSNNSGILTAWLRVSERSGLSDGGGDNTSQKFDTVDIDMVD